MKKIVREETKTVIHQNDITYSDILTSKSFVAYRSNNNKLQSQYGISVLRKVIDGYAFARIDEIYPFNLFKSVDIKICIALAMRTKDVFIFDSMTEMMEAARTGLI